MSLMVNWACHGTVLGPRNYEISGDWPGAAARFVEQAFQDTITSPVTVGASGNINPIYGPHIDFQDVRSYSFAVDSIGMILGEEVLRVANHVTPLGSGTISGSIFTPVPVPRGYRRAAGPLCSRAVFSIRPSSFSSLGAMTTMLGRLRR